ncbi:hypothetical protein FRC08_017372, partial [Ceratobasidium sp. 394]
MDESAEPANHGGPVPVSPATSASPSASTPAPSVPSGEPSSEQSSRTPISTSSTRV